ncbi:MAG TPA: DMT family transporter, partial [Candidatus Saccharimonadales bacterium]|nr:DMT family transporter [Candidatus Saccharimonadales bacterium]
MIRPGVRRSPRQAALFGAACISFSGIFFRFSGASPSTATLFRCGYALPFLAVLMRYEDRRSGGRSRRQRLIAVLAGIFFAADLMLWMHSVEEVGAGLATVMANLSVVIVGLAGWVLLGERPSGRTFVGLPIVLAGAVFISGVFDRNAYGANPLLGVAFGLV